MNVSEYRKLMEDRIETSRQRQAGQPGSATARDGTAAGAAGEAGIEKFAEDETRSEEERCTALNRAATGKREDPQTIEAVLATLRNKSLPLKLRQAAMRNLKLLQFISPVIVDYKGQIIEVLRELLTEDDEILRVEALELLAKKKDARAQELLVASLRNKDERLAPLPKLIQLLGYDIHTDIYPVLRELLSAPTLPEAAKEAARLLSNDSGSAEVLAKAFASVDFPEEVRAVCASALQAIDPRRFESLAKKIVGDSAQPDAVRVVSAVALEKLSNPAALVQDADFKQLVDRVLDSKPVEKLQDALMSLKTRVLGRK